MFTRTTFERTIVKLPAVTLSEQWGATVGKVGGKVFALLGLDEPALVFKVTELSFAGLTSLEGVGQAPYFAKGQWVRVEKHAPLAQADLRAYIAQSHAMVAAKLTRRVRDELGLA